MTLGLFSGITHMWSVIARHKGQIIITKDLINNLERWVAQATMPMILGDFGGIEA
jgi:hypothetical protein